MKESPFQPIAPDRIIAETELALAFADAFPVSKGHTLVVPKRVVACFYDLGAEEQAAVWELVARVRSELADKYHPDGFNIGLNDGPAAGQTVRHAHIHVIPRYPGDKTDPRGGIRWVIPARAQYWRE